MSSSRNIFIQSFNKVFHPNFLSATKVKSIQCQQILAYNSSANCQSLESRQLLNSLIGCNIINNYKVSSYCHVNQSVHVTRAYAILASDRNHENNYNFKVLGQLLNIPVNSRNSILYATQRSLSNNCEKKSEKIIDESGKVDEPAVGTNKDRFKKAMKDYGSVVVIFHLTLSWGSLAFLYLLISR